MDAMCLKVKCDVFTQSFIYSFVRSVIHFITNFKTFWSLQMFETKQQLSIG